MSNRLNSLLSFVKHGSTCSFSSIKGTSCSCGLHTILHSLTIEELRQVKENMPSLVSKWEESNKGTFSVQYSLCSVEINVISKIKVMEYIEALRHEIRQERLPKPFRSDLDPRSEFFYYFCNPLGQHMYIDYFCKEDVDKITRWLSKYLYPV